MIPKEIKYNLRYDDVQGDFLGSSYGTIPATVGLTKSEKGLPSETKVSKNHENRRIGLIESLHMQHCSLWGCIRPPPSAAPAPSSSAAKQHFLCANNKDLDHLLILI